MVRGPPAPKPHQTPETIDDAPPSEDNLQEHNENHPREPVEDNHLQIVPITASPATNDDHQPHAFPPPQEHQPHAFPPPQDDHHQPHAFPPPPQDHQPHAFPPPQDHQPHTFPPPQDHQPHAFPPAQDHQPHAFPPPQDDHHQPHAFPPPQDHQPHAFPPPQDHQPHAFPPAQDSHQGFQGVHAFPPQQNQPFHQQTTPQFPNTNFVNQQPRQMPFNSPMVTGIQPPQPLATQPWKTDLFACMDDPQNAIVTACFPCVTFGQIAEIIDSGNSSCATSGMMYGCVAILTAMPCLLSCTYRTKMRARYGLMETPGPDWLVHCFCEWCALCQVYRELHLRGIDPAIGWQGNQARVQMMQVGSMTPPIRQNMMG